MFRLVVDLHSSDIGCYYWEKLQRNVRCRLLGISVHRASTIFSFESWVIYFPIGCRPPFIKYWQPLLAKTTATCSLPDPENEGQRSVIRFSCCILRIQGIAPIYVLMTELLAAMIVKIKMYQR